MFWRSRTEGARGIAARAFAGWWGIAGGHNLLSGALDIIAAFGLTPFPLFLVGQMVKIATGALSLACLAYYLVYLFTGKRRWIVPVVALYLVTGALGVLYSLQRGPTAVAVTPWRTDLVYDVPRSAVSPAFAAAFLLPAIVGGLAYASLSRWIPVPAQRQRMLLLGLALSVWFTGALLAEIVYSPFWQFATRGGIGLAVAIVVLRAYSPANFEGAGAAIAEPLWAARAAEAGTKAAAFEARVKRLI